MGLYDLVDQVVIDREAKFIDLRIAKSMGTTVEMNWVFTTRTGYDGSAEVMHMQETSAGALVASGYDAAGSYSFRFDGRYLGFGVTHSNPALAFTWDCHK